jgi:beta-ketoacyl-acyl-carrier-protein synthase II
MRRVAVTGLGLVTPLGNDMETTWSRLLEGRSGIGPIRGFDATGFPVRIAAEVKDFDPATAPGVAKRRKLANRSHAVALAAAHEALGDAQTRPEPSDARRWGCVVGAGMMGVDHDELEQLRRAAVRSGGLETERFAVPGAVPADPMAFARSQINAGLSLLTHEFGIRGYASSLHTACASSGQALGTALQLIRRGTADAVLAGGFDSMITPIGLAGFCLLGALSVDNQTPERASRPFDRTRNGFVLGEGAGFLVLEEWDRARRRGARIYAELAGEGTSLSSYRITDSHPSGSGPIEAMQRALRDAGARPSEVDYLNAHGTSTPMNDRSECAAVHAVFGAHAERLAVSSTKSLTGHLIAAAGAVEAALTALAIHRERVPINANLVERDPDCDLDFVVEPRRMVVRTALSNSFGFGGSNSCLALRRVDGGDA